MPTRNAPPNTGTADWGTFAAIAGTNNWNAIRAEKARELQYVAVQNAMQEQEIAKQAQAGQQIQEYFDTIGKLKVLPEGLERIKKVNNELMVGIKDGIKKYNGNVKKYLLSGGINALNQYKNNLLNAEVTQKELVNALNYNRYVADQQAGLQPLDVSWQERGTPKGGSFGQQYEAYKRGDTEVLNYGGAYKMPNVNFGEEFGKRYKYPDKGQVGLADERDVYELAYEMGKELNEPARRDYAKKAVLEYHNYLKSGGSPYTYKSDQITPYQKQMLGLAWNKLKKDELQQSADPWGELSSGKYGQKAEVSFSNAGLQNVFGVQVGEPNGYTTTPATVTPLANDQKKAAATAFNVQYKAGGVEGVGFPAGTKVYTATNKQGQTGLPLELGDIKYSIVDMPELITVNNPDGSSFTPMGGFMIKMNENDAEDLGLYNSDWYWFDNPTAAGEGIVDFAGGDDVLIKVYAQPRYNAQSTALSNYILKNTGNQSGIGNENVLGSSIDLYLNSTEE